MIFPNVGHYPRPKDQGPDPVVAVGHQLELKPKCVRKCIRNPFFALFAVYVYDWFEVNFKSFSMRKVTFWTSEAAFVAYPNDWGWKPVLAKPVCVKPVSTLQTGLVQPHSKLFEFRNLKRVGEFALGFRDLASFYGMKNKAVEATNHALEWEAFWVVQFFLCFFLSIFLKKEAFRADFVVSIAKNWMSKVPVASQRGLVGRGRGYPHEAFCYTGGWDRKKKKMN